MSKPYAGAKSVDGPVLLGTPTPVLLGTRVPYYWERAHAVTLWCGKADSSLSNFSNFESFGLLLTRSARSRNCGRLQRVDPRSKSCRLQILEIAS